MKTMMGKMLFFAAVMSAGCETSMPRAASSEAIKIAALPDVRGCDSLVRFDTGLQLKVQRVSGVDDLYLLNVGGEASCIDSWKGLRVALSRNGIHLEEYASSNPMPGVDPSEDSNSNPMPGTDPAASNPMPGSDPNSSGNH